MKVPIPTENLDLERLGLINKGLFTVEGELAIRYRGVLKTVFGLECDVDSFRVDKRGMSPELCKYFREKHPDKFEFGDNYLNIRSANRFMVVVSPDQKSAPLVAPQASYDDNLFNEVYKQARHTIEDITQSEALFGELEDGISIYRSAEDLLQFRTMEVSLDTLEGTVKSFFELTKMSDNLSEDDNALNHDYIKRMRDLVSKVGDIRNRAISKVFPITKEIHCFYVEFFKGVYCLRNFRSSDDIKTIFITHEQGEPEDMGEQILALDLHDPQVIPLLHKYRFLNYNPELIPDRLKGIEDEVLLSKGIDVVGIEPARRKTLIAENAQNFPEYYPEIKKVARIVGNTQKDINDLEEDISYEARLRLSEPRNKEDILNHLLAEIDPSDVKRLYDFNRRKLICEFPHMPINRQRYIAHALLNGTGGKTK